jgi:hypothetical protein
VKTDEVKCNYHLSYLWQSIAMPPLTSFRYKSELDYKIVPIEGASSFRNKSKVINGAEHVTAKVGRDFNETIKQLLRINIWDVFEKIPLAPLKGGFT